MKEYWIHFDELCNSILLNGNHNAYDGLKNAKLHVNGMTDGWYEFILETEKVLDKHKISVADQKTARILIDVLRSRLDK